VCNTRHVHCKVHHTAAAHVALLKAPVPAAGTGRNAGLWTRWYSRHSGRRAGGMSSCRSGHRPAARRLGAAWASQLSSGLSRSRASPLAPSTLLVPAGRFAPPASGAIVSPWQAARPMPVANPPPRLAGRAASSSWFGGPLTALAPTWPGLDPPCPRRAGSTEGPELSMVSCGLPDPSPAAALATCAIFLRAGMDFELEL
jgi:hypothetical protein